MSDEAQSNSTTVEQDAQDTLTIKDYVLKAGQTHDYIINGERKTIVGGDIAQLTDAQYESFEDKFVPYSEVAVADNTAPLVEDAPADVDPAAGTPVEDGPQAAAAAPAEAKAPTEESKPAAPATATAPAKTGK